MFSIVIQPYNYKHISSINDIKEISVIKFTQRKFLNNDFNYEEYYKGEYNFDIAKKIIEELNNDRVITYSGNLLLKTLLAITNSDENLPRIKEDNIFGIMEWYSDKKPISKRFWRLQDALEEYGVYEDIDTSHPEEVAINTFRLYRKLQDEYNL